MPGFEQTPDLFTRRVKNHLQEIDSRASIWINMVYVGQLQCSSYFKQFTLFPQGTHVFLACVTQLYDTQHLIIHFEVCKVHMGLFWCLNGISELVMFMYCTHCIRAFQASCIFHNFCQLISSVHCHKCDTTKMSLTTNMK